MILKKKTSVEETFRKQRLKKRRVTQLERLMTAFMWTREKIMKAVKMVSMINYSLKGRQRMRLKIPHRIYGNKTRAME